MNKFTQQISDIRKAFPEAFNPSPLSDHGPKIFAPDTASILHISETSEIEGLDNLMHEIADDYVDSFDPTFYDDSYPDWDRPGQDDIDSVRQRKRAEAQDFKKWQSQDFKE